MNKTTIAEARIIIEAAAVSLEKPRITKADVRGVIDMLAQAIALLHHVARGTHKNDN